MTRASPTTAQLAEWQRVTDAATAGPWHVEHEAVGYANERYEVCGETARVNGVTTTPIPAECQSDADATFIATARTAMPLLLAEVVRLNDEPSAARGQMVNALRGELERAEAERDQARADLARETAKRDEAARAAMRAEFVRGIETALAPFLILREAIASFEDDINVEDDELIVNVIADIDQAIARAEAERGEGK